MNSKSLGLVIIIDDDKDICDLLAHLLEHAGYETQQGHDGLTAIEFLTQREPDLLLLDSVIPEPNGMAVLAKARSLYPQLPVVIITGSAGILSAVSAIKAGAFDYIPKPFDSNRVLEVVKQAVQMRTSKLDPNSQSNRDVVSVVGELMGNSPETKRVMLDILRVAKTDFSVIIQGETGTGKELVARNVHLASKRANAVFIPVDCGSMSDTLIENELFGHEKGSFTGADRFSIGKFEAAEGGTLFLDEVANMSLSAQAKLLRVLQERVVYRIGGTKPIPINVRIVSASNEELLNAVAKGAFREDLYYRLNEYVIHIQPLRERPEDIMFLANRFMKEVCADLAIEMPEMTVEAKKVLLDYVWAGNVRELRSVIRRIALIAKKQVTAVDLSFLLSKKFIAKRVMDSQVDSIPLALLPKTESIKIPTSCIECLNISADQGLSLKEIHRINTKKMDTIIIEKMLKETGNNKAEAARRLRVDYKTLCSKLKSSNSK